MRGGFSRFMSGRYGVDPLSRFLFFPAIILMLVSVFTKINWFYFIGIAVFVYSYFRALSRNTSKRYAELQAYERFTGGIKRFFRTRKMHFQQRHTHRFYRCPSCRQDIRVPKGKGRIQITCPKCKQQFIKQT